MLGPRWSPISPPRGVGASCVRSTGGRARAVGGSSACGAEMECNSPVAVQASGASSRSIPGLAAALAVDTTPVGVTYVYKLLRLPVVTGMYPPVLDSADADCGFPKVWEI